MSKPVTQIAKIDQFKGVLNTQTLRAQLKNSLKDNAGAFMSSMIDLYNGDKGLQACNPEAVALECVKAAALNLPIVKSLGFAYVVAYGSTPTFIVGYKGLIQLAQRSGLYKTLNADKVFEGELVGKDKLSGMIDLSGEATSDKVIGYFAYFKLTNGFEKILFMTKEQIDAYAKKYSKTFNSEYSPWKTAYDEMAQKTVLRRLIGKYGPMTTEIMNALEGEDTIQSTEREIEENANKDVIDISAEPIDIPVQLSDGQTALVDQVTGEVKEAKKQPPAKPNF